MGLKECVSYGGEGRGRRRDAHVMGWGYSLRVVYKGTDKKIMYPVSPILNSVSS